MTSMATKKPKGLGRGLEALLGPTFNGPDSAVNDDSAAAPNPTTLQLEPGLAESWSVSDDGLTYTFKMKAGLTFSSGNPVRAEDAAYSLQRAIKLNKTPAFILNQFGWSIENVDSMISGTGDTLTIKVDKPYAPTFLYNCLTAGVASIVDAEVVKANEVVTDGVSDLGNEYLKTHSAGTGASTLKSFKPNEG